MRADIVLGVVTVLMALLGGAVALHAPAKWQPKIIYAAIFAVLGVISIIYVIKQSNETAIANQNLGAALSSLGQSTTKIADMTTLNSQLQDKLLKQSETITDLSKQNIAAVTGGNTFCYVIANPVFNEFLLNIGTIGTSPLHEVTIELTDVDKMRTVVAGKPTLSFEEIQSYTTNFPIVPFLEPTSGRMLARIPIGTPPKRYLQFNFFSLNGVWSETLKLELVNGKWAQAIKVIKVLPVVRGKVRNKTLYTFATDNFPKKDGKVDWEN
jgi:hypothetical protein